MFATGRTFSAPPRYKVRFSRSKYSRSNLFSSGVLATLLHVFSSSPVTEWGRAGSCCLQVWRDLSLANTDLPAATANMKEIISAVLLGLKNSPASPLWSSTLLSLLSVLQDLPAPESVLVTVDQVLDLITGTDTETSREVVESFARLFTTYCYPADQLASLTVRLDSSRDSENLSSYLDMLEQVMNNLAESEARWAANLMEVKEAERDSALKSSELEENNNNNSGTRLEEFSPYLAILRTGGESCVELTLSHLHRLVARADGDSRHKIALQVILPYLASSLDTGGEEKEGEV